MKWPFDPCRRQRENLALLAAGVLSAPERAKVERHLIACPQCQTYFTEIKSVANLLATSAHADAEIQPSADVMARWETAIRSAKTALAPQQTGIFELLFAGRAALPRRRAEDERSFQTFRKMVARTPHPGPLPIGSADSADAEREKRAPRCSQATTGFTRLLSNFKSVSHSRSLSQRERARMRENVDTATPLANHQLSWWREVIWPWRRAWIGLSGVWIILVAFHLAQHDVGPKAVASSRTAMASFREQQKMLNELLADRSSAPDADRPKLFSPKPRTERDQTVPV